MNVKKMLEEIGLIEVKYYLHMENIHKGLYTREMGNVLGNLAEIKQGLIEQVVERMVDLNPTGKPIPLQKKSISDRTMMEKNIENWTKIYEEGSKTPLPSEQKEQLKNLL